MKKYEIVYRNVKEKIISGLYPENTRLPSKRDMAHMMSVSLNTVEIAYAQLQDEGYIEAMERRGYFVAKRDYMKKSMGTISRPIYREKVYKYDFSYGGVDEKFPFGVWKKISKEAIDDLGSDLLKRVNPMGDMSLRESIATYLKAYRGIGAKMENILISASTEHLFQILFCILEDDKVFGIEDPGFERWSLLFRTNNIPFKALSLDGKGVSKKAVENSGLDILCITPAHQFPTGQTMPVAKRLDILKWASQDGRWIIEDDYDGEFRYSGKPLPAMKSMDEMDKVIFMGSFSNTVSPAMRISYMVLPDILVDIYHKRVSYTACPVPVLAQRSLDIFIREGYFVRHINRMRKIYKKKMELVKDIVDGYEFLNLEGGDTGLHLVLTWDRPGYKKFENIDMVPNELGDIRKAGSDSQTKKNLCDISGDELADLADKRNIRVTSLSSYYIGEAHKEGLVLGFASMSLEDIEDGLTKLLELFGYGKLLEK